MINKDSYHWIYRLFYHYNRGKAWKNYYLSFLFFVVPPVVIFAYPLITRFGDIPPDPIRIVALSCAGLWTYLGPILIYKFYDGYFLFHDKVLQGSDACDKEIETYFAEIHQTSRKVLPVITVLWVGFVLTVLICYPQPLRYYGVYGYRDGWYWLFLIYVGFVLSQTAVGISDALMTLLLIRKLLKSKAIVFDVLDEEIGGCRYFGDFFMLTFLCLCSGVLFIPILVHYVAHSGIPFSRLIPSAAMIFYSIMLLLSFLLPYLKLTKLIEQCKQERLRILEETYRNLLFSTYFSGKANEESMERHVKLLSLSDSIRYIRSIDSRPVRTSRLVHVFVMALSPFVIELVPNLVVAMLF